MTDLESLQEDVCTALWRLHDMESVGGYSEWERARKDGVSLKTLEDCVAPMRERLAEFVKGATENIEDAEKWLKEYKEKNDA